LPPSSGSKDNPSKKPAETGFKQSLMGLGVGQDREGGQGSTFWWWILYERLFK
jgi:hypothetical protein